MIEFNLDTLLLVNWTVAVFLPLLVGLVTNRLTSSLVKALLLALLNTLVSVGTELARTLQDGTTFDAGQALFQVLTALAIAWGAYGQFWKPTGVAESAQRALTNRNEDV